MTQAVGFLPEISATHRADRLDRVVEQLIGRIPATRNTLAAVALGAYGRREVTPCAPVELLILRAPNTDAAVLTEQLIYPLWEHTDHLDYGLRTLDEAASAAANNFAVATSCIDARYVAGDRATFELFEHQVSRPIRQDHYGLRRRLGAEIPVRHQHHASPTGAAEPDLLSGRGGLRDLDILTWLGANTDPRTHTARDLFLRTCIAHERDFGHRPNPIKRMVQPGLADALGYGTNVETFMRDLYGHARWVAFRLDDVFAPPRRDRRFGLGFQLQRGQLVADRLPPIDRAPHLGLRAAKLVGLAPPSSNLLAWASTPGGALAWDEPTLDAFYLLLRAADPRSWEFLDISGLLVRYLPEWAVVYRRPPGPGGDLALDSHTFEVLRRLHEWSASGEAASQRVWPRLRHRDWLYVAAFLHELSPDGARSACERIGLPAEGCATVTFVIEHFRELTQVATQRDLHDEELVLDLAGTIGTLQRLDHLYALAIAEDQGLGGASWTPWKAQLLNDLFARLEHLLEHPAESGVRQRRSLDHLRQQAADELRAIGCNELISMVPHLPHRFLLARPPSAVARHLALAGQDLPAADAVQIQATPHRSSAVWELEVVARDRPGLLATIAGVLSLRGITVLSADAATCSNGLVLDVFTVASAYGQPLDAGIWPKVRADLEAGLKERLPLRDLLAHRTSDEPSGATVRVDNTASQFYSLVEVRAPDRVGLLYRIALGLSELGVDIHHAKIATQPSGVIDTFYVWKATGGKLEEGIASIVACELERRLA